MRLSLRGPCRSTRRQKPGGRNGSPTIIPLYTIRSSLRKHGISDYFRFLISPQVANAPQGKLDPAMWEYGLEQAEVAPEEAAHIGDRYEHDVVGARVAGVLPIFIDREGEHDEPDCPKAADLMEAVQLLI